MPPLVGLGTALIGASTAATIGAVGTGIIGAGAAYAGYKAFTSFTKPPEQTSFQGSDAQQRNTQAVADLQDAQNTASTDAAKLIAKRRRSGTQTVFTNPLGVSDQATTARKVLLGE